jgi:hypothetical protein
MCSCKTNTSTLNASDNDWYLTEKTINNAIQLTRYLMQVYKIDINHIIMHHMVTGKWCPQPWSKNEAALSGWYDFQKRIGNAGAGVSVQPQSQASPTAAPYLVKITANVLNIRSGPGTDYAIVDTIKDHGIYTIIDEKNGFGKLKSGKGWISLQYTQKKG